MTRRPFENGEGPFLTHGRSVAVGGGEEVEDFRHVDDASEQRDGLVGQSVGIAVSVPSFVMVADRVSDLVESLDTHDAVADFDVHAIGSAIFRARSRMHV